MSPLPLSPGTWCLLAICVLYVVMFAGFAVVNARDIKRDMRKSAMLNFYPRNRR